MIQTHNLKLVLLLFFPLMSSFYFKFLVMNCNNDAICGKMLIHQWI